MTSEEFIEQQISAGYEIHYNKGVWWQKIWHYFYKPVVYLQDVVPGRSYPKTSKSFLGYKHVVSDKRLANQSWPVMLLLEEKLKGFTIYSLPSPKRARVRKGLKLTMIKKIENIEDVIEDVKNACISTRSRTQHGKPEDYYDTKEWRSFIIKEFSFPKREWWGAYDGERLVSYLYSVLIDSVMYITTLKSQTDSLKKCPNDALIFSVLSYCRELPDCKQVMFGDGGQIAPGVNAFKKHFGFTEISMPVFAKYNPLVTLYKRRRKMIFPKKS